MSSQPVIVVENARKTFESERGPVPALDGFSMTVNEAEFVSIVGPSGCGKSTLLWAMASLWPLTSGSIKINGEEITGPRREVGMVFQTGRLSAAAAGICSAKRRMRALGELANDAWRLW